MADKLLIEIPEGYSGIDMEKSDFDKGIIVFKKKQKTPWKDSNPEVNGFYIDEDNRVISQESSIKWIKRNRNIFATEKQAKSVQAMSELSQIIANDERFGGPITDKEWDNPEIDKYVIERYHNNIVFKNYYGAWSFLAFRSPEKRDIFYIENEDLIKQYYMLD